MSFSCAHALLVAAVSLAPAADADQVFKNLQGKWKPESVEHQGNQLYDDSTVNLQSQTFRIEKDKFFTTFAAFKQTSEGKLKIDASVTPKRLEIEYPDGKTLRGIFALDDDFLIISFQIGRMKTKWPTRFTTHPEDREDSPIVYILRRQ